MTVLSLPMSGRLWKAGTKPVLRARGRLVKSLLHARKSRTNGTLTSCKPSVLKPSGRFVPQSGIALSLLDPAAVQLGCIVLQKRERLGLQPGDTDPALDEFSDSEWEVPEDPPELVDARAKLDMHMKQAADPSTLCVPHLEVHFVVAIKEVVSITFRSELPVERFQAHLGQRPSLRTHHLEAAQQASGLLEMAQRATKAASARELLASPQSISILLSRPHPSS